MVLICIVKAEGRNGGRRNLTLIITKLLRKNSYPVKKIQPIKLYSNSKILTFARCQPTSKAISITTINNISKTVLFASFFKSINQKVTPLSFSWSSLNGLQLALLKKMKMKVKIQMKTA